MTGIDWSPLKPNIDYKNLDPQTKLDILKDMGFSAVWDQHQPDCAWYMMGSGNICNCVPPGTSWYPPRDVKVHMGETWEELRAKAGINGEVHPDDL